MLSTEAFIEKELNLFIKDSIETYYQNVNDYKNLYDYMLQIYHLVEADIKLLKGENFAIEFKKKLLEKIEVYKNGVY